MTMEICSVVHTIRLCAACYAEQPHHRTHWQYKATAYCEPHGLALLSRPVAPAVRLPFRYRQSGGLGYVLGAVKPLLTWPSFKSRL